MPAPRLLLDMDGVIADFVTPSIQAHGKTDLPLTRLTVDEWQQLYLDEAELDRFWGPERDEVAFYEAPKWAYFEDWGLDFPAFWQPIREMGHDFWENLPVLPWGPALVRHVAKLDPDFLFVTYPDSHPAAYSGKYAWLQKHFPEYADKLVPIRDKTVLVRPNWLLIDDVKKQVDGFCEAGGAAFLWPARYNRPDSPDTFFSPIIRELPALFAAITTFWADLSVEPHETASPASQESILEEAIRITRGSRQEAYGHPYDNFMNTARIATRCWRRSCGRCLAGLSRHRAFAARREAQPAGKPAKARKSSGRCWVR